MTEIQVKRTVKAGNSSAVVLPRSWLNREVRVELLKKTEETILLETLEIAKKYLNTKDIIGVYLTGSYSRNEEDEESDIDILIITRGIDKPLIREGAYSILIASKELINQKLENDILPIGQMIKEAKPLLNSDYLDSIEVKVTEKNTRWYIKTTEEKLSLVERLLNFQKNTKYEYEGKEKISPLVAYTLVLRIRTLDIIKGLIENKSYSKKDFIRLIKQISGSENAYKSYLSIKNNSKEKTTITPDEASRLHEYLEKQLKSIKNLIN